MAEPSKSPSDIDAISYRLGVTRRALQLKKSEFADRAKIGRKAYQNWDPKEGKKPVGRPNIDEATKLCNAYGLTLDWIYRGDPSRLPHELVEAIASIERAERAAAITRAGKRKA